ncbi:hypothetical protein DEJ45_05005 [Streptomyces venezuelae]|uniref:hypothetical protein n=1 Tax=Streptomyces venezuelae TaxID=54571 RepID=UPI00123DF95F|nr:hypothetical protein [Streptomyces venezuelae]QES11814.1 hypothetical protein DEJ45_05005 [Streptomyces venezuelae]
MRLWTPPATDSATEWLAASPGASVVDVSAQSRTLYIQARTPGDLPPVETLLADLEGQIPDGVPVVVVTSEGRQVQAGRVGG